MIKRQLPVSFTGSPLARFSVLLVGQGFTRSEFQTIRQQTWELLKTRCTIFADAERPNLPESGALAVFYESGESLDLGITQTGRKLEMSSAGRTALGQFLAGQTLKNDVGESVPASSVWTPGGRRGAAGSVVLIVVKGSTGGDLYDIPPAEADRVPVAGAVVVQGEHWVNVLARAMGQMIASLADEYALPNSGPAPETIFGPFPNLVRISDLDREQLLRGDKPTDVILCFGPAWEKFPRERFSFHQFAGQTEQGMGLYEGGATYSANILRSNFDCLMKRIPFAAGTDSIQGDLGFCPVCQEALHLALGRLRSFELVRTRKRLGTQRLDYDMVNWAGTEKVEPLPANRAVPTVVQQGPKWSFTLNADSQVGLRLSDVNLAERPGDPFAAATAVFKTIEFTDLKVKFKGEPETSLTFANPFANTVDKPRLLIAGPGPAGLFQRGLKLKLTWNLPNKYLVDVTLSVVLRGERNDFDPGGAAAACKVFPQIAMSYRARGKGYSKSTAALPAVEYLKGTVRLENNGIIPKDIVIPPGLPSEQEMFLKEHMAVGTLRPVFVTDSNSSHFDSEYDADKEQFLSFFKGRQSPWGRFDRGEWKSGRKLAGVKADGLGDTWDVGAGTAWFGYTKHKGPVLPNWSWLFDYIDLNIAAKKKIVGAFTLSEKKAQRETKIDWPPPAQVTDGKAYKMTVRKLPRQGAYDNIHMHPEMLRHGTNPPQPLITAPFCAEKCFHLHWRWGVDAVNSMSTPYEFLGWDGVGAFAVAHHAAGMPLIPPNQHLDVTVDPIAPDATTGQPTRVVVLYEVRADDPKVNEQQVFLEQGIGFAYRYAIGQGCAPSIPQIGILMIAIGAIPPQKSDDGLEAEVLKLTNARRDNPALFDAFMRQDFHTIYGQLRFYNQSRDNVSGDNVEQVPTAPADLEAL